MDIGVDTIRWGVMGDGWVSGVRLLGTNSHVPGRQKSSFRQWVRFGFKTLLAPLAIPKKKRLTNLPEKSNDEHKVALLDSYCKYY